MSSEFQQAEKYNALQHTMPAFAAATGFMDSVKYVRTLQIKPSELGHYFKKTTNLAICYAGFAQDVSLTQAKGAGHAAFLSCAYDVVTDWQKPTSLQTVYARILQQETSPELTNMALGLLGRDVKGILLDDGLERGIVATEFVLQLMGVREVVDSKCDDIRELGLDFQIVDDVLDWEDDSKLGDQNCLTNTQLREQYLRRLPQHLHNDRLRELFPYGGILTYAISRARSKAEKMLISPERYFP